MEFMDAKIAQLKAYLLLLLLIFFVLDESTETPSVINEFPVISGREKKSEQVCYRRVSKFVIG